MRSSLFDVLKTKYLLGDGAMATELYRAGLPVGECPELWNVGHPEKVAAVHRFYVDAGADCLVTNTFGGNRLRLDACDLAAQVEELNREAVRLAREAAGEDRWVLGSVGPASGKDQPPGTLDATTVGDSYREQIAVLAAGGVDAILLETVTDLDEAELALQACSAAAPGVPVIVSLAFRRLPGGGGFDLPRSGEKMDAAAKRLAGWKTAGVGANCGVHLDVHDYGTIIAALRAAVADGAVLARPNAGQPVACGAGAKNDLECTESPEMMVEGVWGIVRAGANLIGGCCGTTPEHVRLFREELDRL